MTRFVLSDAVDLFNIELAEDGPTALHAMPNNKIFKHPRYGDISFTPERIQRFADNVNNNVRGIPLDIDYDHKQSQAHGTKAAGWVLGAEARDDGLFYNIEFTEDAKEAIRKHEYRFFSPEFADEWTDPNTGKKYKDVAFGGGLTNRPFLRDHIAPVSLSELEDFTPEKEKKIMGWLEGRVAAILGLSEQSSDEEIRAALNAPNSAPPVGNTNSGTGQEIDLSEHPEFKRIQTQLAAQEVALREARVETQLNALTQGKFTLSAPQREIAKGLLLNLNDEAQTKLGEFLSELTKTGVVQLGEEGTGNPAGGDSRTLSDPVAEVERQIDKLMSDDDLDYRAAADKVFSENPDLHLKYRNATFISGEVK
jgi:hypothetical protein